MPRTIQPELLDTLPPENPDALHSRRDLRLINTFMGNHRWLERALKRNARADERILEIGAGTGELARRLRSAGLAAECTRIEREDGHALGRAVHRRRQARRSRADDRDVVRPVREKARQETETLR